MKITRIGVDLAKKVFQVHDVNACGNGTSSERPGREVGIEACGGTQAGRAATGRHSLLDRGRRERPDGPVPCLAAGAVAGTATAQ